MKDNKMRTTLKVMITAAILILIITISFAFMHNTLEETMDPTELNTTTVSNLTLLYSDCASTNTSDCTEITAALEPGQSITKTFEVTNESQVDIPYTLYFQEYLNTFKNDELVYKIENKNTGEILVEQTPIPYASGFNVNAEALKGRIPAASTVQFKMTITLLNTDYNQNENLNARFSIKLSLEKATKTAFELIKESVNAGTPDFEATSTETEGIYAMADDYGTSYYYRGAVENNYMFFAGFYWRIIRINGDNSMRIIYDGTAAHINGEASSDRFAINNVSWNAEYDNDAKYVGYMYAGTNGENSISLLTAQTNETDSLVKTQVDAWYKTNIVDAGYSKYVSDEIFCNDRSISSGTGYGQTSSYFSKYTSLTIDHLPKYTCPQTNDAFTKSDAAKGNGNLTYPVGLITADELSAAGNTFKESNINNYLYKGGNYWTITPYIYDEHASMIILNDNGTISFESVDVGSSVAPVINISSEYATALTGTGTIDDSYLIAIN